MEAIPREIRHSLVIVGMDKEKVVRKTHVEGKKICLVKNGIRK